MRASAILELLKFDNSWELLLKRSLFRSNPWAVYRHHGKLMLLDHDQGDQNGIRPCLLTPMYRAFLERSEVPKNPVVLDLGANSGGFSLLLQTIGKMPSKLVAVEMNPLTFSRLQLNLFYNIKPLPVVLNNALTGDLRRIRVNPWEGGSGQSIYDSGDSHSLEIDGLPLDVIIDRYFGAEEIDLCKIDVEGAEYEVFSGGQCSRIRQCRNLVIEIHGGEDRDPSRVKSAILDFGFSEVKGIKTGEADVFFYTRS